jgi:hypothetical protein
MIACGNTMPLAKISNCVAGSAVDILRDLQIFGVVTVTAAPISIKARVIAATSLSAVEPDIRDLRPVPDVGSVIDD